MDRDNTTNLLKKKYKKKTINMQSVIYAIYKSIPMTYLVFNICEAIFGSKRLMKELPICNLWDQLLTQSLEQMQTFKELLRWILL